MNTMEIKTDLECAMRQLCEIKNKLRKVAAMLTPEQERQPDLFTAMGLTKEPLAPAVEALTIEPEEPETDIPWGPATVAREPQRRTWKKLTVQMKDTAIVAAEKVGRKSGWCQRSDIERSLQRRNPERSREEIREAVNAAVDELGLTCVKYNSYRFYRTSDRGRIIAVAAAKLTAWYGE